MESGSSELSRMATAYLASFAFALTFLVALVAGCDLGAALWRGTAVLAAALLLGRFLSAPVVDAVLQAMARDAAKRRGDSDRGAGP